MTALGWRHAALGAFVVGLAASGLGVGVAVVLGVGLVVAGTVAVTSSVRSAAVVSAAVLVGAGVGSVRLQTLERDRLGPLPRTAAMTVVVLEVPRARQFGVTVAAARVQGGRAAGARVLLRVTPGRRRAAWPPSPIGTVVDVRGRLTPLPSSESAEGGDMAAGRLW